MLGIRNVSVICVVTVKGTQQKQLQEGRALCARILSVHPSWQQELEALLALSLLSSFI